MEVTYERMKKNPPSQPDNNFWFKCTKCGKIFDLRIEGYRTKTCNLCDKCKR